MKKRILLCAMLSLAAAGIAYSANQLSDPVPAKANEVKCCTSNAGCGGGTCGTHSCGGLNGGAC